MGGEREIIYNYKNNDTEDPTDLTRVYAHDTTITSDNDNSGYSGHRDLFTCEVNWQDGLSEDVTYEEKVWTSTVISPSFENGSKIPTAEYVNYIGEEWVNGYVDVKGDRHSPSVINEFYIPNPISNTFYINCDYPHDEYTNGLSGAGFLEDLYAPGHSHHVFSLTGIDNIVAIDITPSTTQHDIDVDNPSSPHEASNYNGIGTAPTPNAFNNKTYQTGHFYDFILNITFDDGLVLPVYSSSEFPELSWRILDKDVGSWVTNRSMYKSSGYNTNVPNTVLDHRLPYQGWNSIRSDVFSESGIPMPIGDNNYQLNKT